MKKILITSIASLALVSLVGCANSTATHQTPQASHVIEQAVVVSVVGYGAPHHTYETAAQRRLMALRASELDAYRKLSEQISGVHISGDSSVDNYIAQRDRLKGNVSTFIQGATITHQEYQSDGVAVTNMQMKVNPNQIRRMIEIDRTEKPKGQGLIPGSAFIVR